MKSSLSSVIDKANDFMQVQKKQITEAKERAKKYAVGSIVVASFTIAALLFAGYQLTISAMSIIDDARERIDITKKQEVRLDKLQQDINALQQEIIELKHDRQANYESKLTSRTKGTDNKSNGQIETNSEKVQK